MHSLMSKRTTAGNICLVVFIAFLSLIIFGTVGPVGSANASNEVKVYNDSSATQENGSSNRLVFTTSASMDSVEITLYLKPVTDTNFNGIWADFTSINSDSAYSKVYLKNNGSQVNGTVYKLVYTLPLSGFSTQTNYSVPVYYPDEVNNFVVYAYMTIKPPESGGGGGGGGSASTTSQTSTGTVVSNPTTGTASVAVDSTKISQVLTQQPTAKEVVLELPTTVAATTKEARFDIPATVLTKVAEATKNLVVKAKEVVLTIPPAALDVPEVQQALNASAKVSVEVTVKEVAAETASQQVNAVLAKPENKDFAAVGKVFEFSVQVKPEDGEAKEVKSFSKKVTVSIPYNPADLKGASEDKLGAYKVTANGLEYRYSRVDKTNHRVYFDTPGFSLYTLMAYNKTFADLTGHWSKADVELMAAKHIAKGMTQSEFVPDAVVTRAQFATLLQRVLDLPLENPANARFADVTSDAWYYGAVEAAAKAGLVNGYEDGTFQPDAQITRQEMAAMVARAMRAGGKTVTLNADQVAAVLAKFQDASAIQAWAQEAAAIAVQEGIVQGRTADQYAPNADATRAEGTVMLKRLLSALGRL
ncbi:MAG: S-layer homology domain-containing protein [Firmicutes bacterium]|nr:S-layer homology domain-containing protein [Bacillota bacterium]